MLMAAFSIFAFSLLLSLHVSQTLSIPETYGSPPPLSTTVSLLAPILSSLNYSQLAVAVPYLSSPILSSPWPTPITLFAFSSNPDPQLLKEHLAPGLFTFSYLSDLKFGSKLQTVDLDRCLTVTSVAGTNKVFIDGAEIIHPDLYNDGRIVIHGITDVLAPLPSDSCNANNDNVITSLMLKDSVAKLRSVGFGILAGAIQFSWLDLVELKNMTVFALDDVAIVSGGGFGYIRDLRFHIVPNRMVRVEELMQAGLVMESMETGRHLIVTGRGMVNFVPVREGEVVVNGRVVVHRLGFPFSRLDLADLAILEDEYFNGGAAASTTNMSALGGGSGSSGR